LKPDDERLEILLHTTQGNLSPSEWMKKDWDERAKVDVLYFVYTRFNQTEKDFWNSKGPRDKKILGVNTQRFDQIIKNKNPKKMRILEIGCGVGRVILPMSEIFGEVIGIDVSGKMVEIAQKYLRNEPNCKVYENNGMDLSMFPENYFDFCYSIITFQHVPEKEIVLNYVKEVYRVLKPGCLFRFQVIGDTKNKPSKFDTWSGIHFTSQEIHKIAQEHKFKILEESGQFDQYYWLTFKSKK